MSVFPDGIVKKIRKSDRLAFRQLFDFFQDSLYRYIFYKIRDEDAAEDILQDVFIKVWEHRKELKEDGLQSYLFTIANNLSLNHLRHGKIILKHEDFVRNTTKNSISNTPMEKEELMMYISLAVDKLSEKTKNVFLMSRNQQMSYKEIAKELGISISTVESHMVKALRTIRESIPPEYLSGYGGKS